MKKIVIASAVIVSVAMAATGWLLTGKVTDRQYTTLATESFARGGMAPGHAAARDIRLAQAQEGTSLMPRNR